MIDSPVSNSITRQPCPRVVFFGMPGYYSSAVLTSLLQSDIELCAVVLPAVPLPGEKRQAIQRREPPRTLRSILPLAQQNAVPSIMQLVWQRRIPVWEIDCMRHPDTIATLASYQADLWCVACFSKRFPHALFELPRLGCLNVHPSLLPENRGPVPLFWTFREGLDATGVTVHFLEERMDAGDIVVQERIMVPDGITYNDLEGLCARRGGKALVRAIWELFENRAARHPQDEARSSYHSQPAAQDFVVKVKEWNARHVYNFIHGISSWDTPVTLVDQNSFYVVRDALGFGFGVSPIEEVNSEIRLFFCREGWIHVSIVPTTI